MAFTRKHFNVIAGALANYGDQAGPFHEVNARRLAANELAHRFADIFATDTPIFDNNGNRRFDRRRFLEACGVPCGVEVDQ